MLLGKVFLGIYFIYALNVLSAETLVEVPGFPQFKYDLDFLLKLGSLKSREEMNSLLHSNGVKVIIIPTVESDTESSDIKFFRLILELKKGLGLSVTLEDLNSLKQEYHLDTSPYQCSEHHLILLKEHANRVILLHETLHYLFLTARGYPSPSSKGISIDAILKTSKDLSTAADKNLENLIEELDEELAVNQTLLLAAKELTLSPYEIRLLLHKLQTDPDIYYEKYVGILLDYIAFNYTLSKNDPELKKQIRKLVKIKKKYLKQHKKWIQQHSQFLKLSRHVQKWGPNISPEFAPNFLTELLKLMKRGCHSLLKRLGVGQKPLNTPQNGF